MSTAIQTVPDMGVKVTLSGLKAQFDAQFASGDYVAAAATKAFMDKMTAKALASAPASNPSKANVINGIPQKRPAEVKAKAAPVATTRTASIDGSIVTLTFDLNERAIWFDADGNVREDKKGNFRPYVSWSIEVEDRRYFLGMSIPDIR